MAVSSTKTLTGLRIAVGVLFLIFGEYKVVGTQFTLGGGFQYWIGRFLQDGAYPFMVPVLKNFVLSHATPIAFLVAYGELAIGIALVLGLLVRAASVCAASSTCSAYYCPRTILAHMPPFGSTSALLWNT